MRGPRTFLRKYWPEILLLLMFVGLSLYYDAQLKSRLDIDSHRYLELGNRLLETGRFEHRGLDGNLTPDYSRTPTFPLLIAASMSIFGKNSTAAITAVIWLQRLAWAGSVCWLLPRIRSGSGRVRPWSLIGKVVLLFSPVVLYHGALLLTDLLYAAGLLAACRLTFRSLNQQPVSALPVGLFHGVLTLLRPVHLLVPVILSLPFIRHRNTTVVVLIFAAFLVPAGWMIRNHSIHDSYSLVALDGRALALHREQTIRQMQPADSSAEYGPEFIAALHSTNENPITAAWILMRDYQLTEIHADKTAKAVALEAIRTDPLNYLKQTASNLGRLVWSRIDGYNVAQVLMPAAGERTWQLAGTANGIWGVVMFLLIPVWLVVTRIRLRHFYNRVTIALILLALYMAALPAFTTVTYGRFMLPLLPLVGLVYCMADIGPQKKSSRRWQEKNKKKNFPES